MAKNLSNFSILFQICVLTKGTKMLSDGSLDVRTYAKHMFGVLGGEFVDHFSSQSSHIYLPLIETETHQKSRVFLRKKLEKWK